MSTMDYRMAARRLAVRENVARTRLRWLAAMIFTVLAAGAMLVAARSEMLAVRSIEINGVVNADVASVLRDEGLAAGIPTISVRPGAIETALAANPWVARADVRLVWPGAVEITILEHVTAGWIKGEQGWVRVSTTGAVLERSKPPKRAAVVKGKKFDVEPGHTIEDERIIAALEFLALLPPRLSQRAEVRTGGASLMAIVNGHKVELGSADDMQQKAATLIAVMDDGVARKARISLISPSRPAVRNPRGQVESLGLSPTSDRASG